MRDSRPMGKLGDEGFVLIAVIVLVFLVLLTLTIAAPRVALQLKREREVEATHRANQYVRAIRMYYKKFGHYPGSVEQLEKSNNQRFLRQRYLDPMTGKDDWRLIHVGENKTKVKGFFGQELEGVGGGLGSAAGMQSATDPSSTTGGRTSGFGTSSFGGSSPGSGNTLGSGATGGPTATSGLAGGGQTSAPGLSSGTGIGSQSASDFKGGGGPIMGIGSSQTGEAIVVVNEQTNYQDWEFLYDPRIEALYAKGSLLGGISSGSATGGGLGSTGNGLTPFGTPPGTPPGGVPTPVTPLVPNPNPTAPTNVTPQ